MSTTEIEIVNRRGWDPDDDEQERLRHRHVVRERIARAQLAAMRSNELRAELRKIDVKLDSLASDHEANAQEIQSELRAVEERLIAALAERKPTPEADETRRKELLRQLSEANAKLQSDLEGVQKLRPALEAEIRKLSRDSVAATENDLANPRVARRDLYIRWQAAREAAGCIGRGMNALRKAQFELQDQLATREKQRGKWESDAAEMDYLRLRLDVLEAAVTEASNHHGILTQKAAEAHQAILDE
jgi:hypothetical protein